MGDSRGLVESVKYNQAINVSIFPSTESQNLKQKN